MLIAVCLIASHTVCIIGNLVLFGRISGIFANEAFVNACGHEGQSLIMTNKSYSLCPFGIELNAYNYARLHR